MIERILGDPRLTSEFITVEVQNGVVNLIGSVSSLYARVTAADLARSTPGVADICNRLALSGASDATADPRHPDPDPFDDIVAGWHVRGAKPQRTADRRSRPPTGTLRAAAGLLAATSGILWLALVPLHPGAGFVVVVCLAGAAALAVLAGQASS
ncbi:BON domain-containing protein [Actinoplanes sp. NEAU-H7]|uniref:BON domain-containing protein n=1 Tax=Actinoplanes flavus TaxID=2820290 RepID=A0ABS3UZY6_9ACTN|nr:BON domain-containing protein [Actinoplanes flavus]